MPAVQPGAVGRGPEAEPGILNTKSGEAGCAGRPAGRRGQRRGGPEAEPGILNTKSRKQAVLAV